MATYMYTPDGITPRSGCRHPRIYTGDQWLDTTWDDALAVYGGLIEEDPRQATGPSGIVFSASTTAAPAAASRTPGAPAS